MAAAVDWSNPCARAAALLSAYYNLVSGQQEVEIRTRTLDSEELVRFTAANATTLKREAELAQAECDVASGSRRPRRFAFRAG